MPDVVSNDELNALAAEYVLGTLDYEERKGASALLEVDATFRGIVRIWERRFGDLHLMVEAVTPDPQLWQRIRPKIPGLEQITPAIPSHADEPPAAVAAAATATAAAPAAESAPPVVPTVEAVSEEPKAAAPKTDAVVAEGTASPAATETPPAESKPVEVLPAEATPAEPTPVEAAVAKPQAAEAAPAEAALADSKPADSKPDDSKPDDSKPPAIVEAELKLAELAALLPVADQDGVERAAPPTEAPTEPVPAQPMPEEGLHTHAPDTVPRGFVPPVPMSTRGAPTVVEVPVRKGGGGWVAATLTMALIAVALAGLISAWRFFPDRLPAQLRANTLLNLNVTTTAAQPAPKARPKLAPFDE